MPLDNKIKFSGAIVTDSVEVESKEEDPSIIEVKKVKEGPLKFWETRFLRKKQWKDCYGILYSDSTFGWYAKKGDTKPIDSLLLKNYVEDICTGELAEYTNSAFSSVPSEIPPNCSELNRMAIGDILGLSSYHFLFNSTEDIEEWFIEIVKVIPKPGPDVLTQNAKILEVKASSCYKDLLPPIKPLKFASKKLEETIMDHGIGCLFIELHRKSYEMRDDNQNSNDITSD